MVEGHRGAYGVRRAAALAGVPMRTLQYWAQHGIYEPSVWPGPRDRLWSWGDLLALRAIDWYRRSKGVGEPARTTIADIRRAIAALDRLGLPRSSLAEITAVAQDGRIFITTDATRFEARPGQIAAPELLNLVQPYLGGRGPDLLTPRPLLRILPGKLNGEPHLSNTRISTSAIYELHRSGYSIEQIQDLYPEAERSALVQAIEFEESLTPKAA